MPAPITQRLSVRKRTQKIDMLNGRIPCFFYIFFPRYRRFACKHGNCSLSCEEYERFAPTHRPQSFAPGNDAG
jgi:hypothetical protein